MPRDCAPRVIVRGNRSGYFAAKTKRLSIILFYYIRHDLCKQLSYWPIRNYFGSCVTFIQWKPKIQPLSPRTTWPAKNSLTFYSKYIIIATTYTSYLVCFRYPQPEEYHDVLSALITKHVFLRDASPSGYVSQLLVSKGIIVSSDVSFKLKVICSCNHYFTTINSVEQVPSHNANPFITM